MPRPKRKKPSLSNKRVHKHLRPSESFRRPQMFDVAQKPYPFQKAILLRWFAILQAYFLNGYKGLYKLEAV